MGGREPTMREAIVGVGLTIAVVVFGVNMKVGTETPLMMGVITAAIFGLYLGCTWEYLQEGMIESVKEVIVACIILVLIGMLVGVWIIGGIVPTMIYYGLKLISPRVFLPVTFVLCAITSVMTGTSFGSIATVGLALMGVGRGMSIPNGPIAGAIVSGAFFGDKMSPLSDTTNVAAAISGTDLYRHVWSMMWTTVPATILCVIAYTIVGSRYGASTLDRTVINGILEALENNFNLSLLAFLPPLLVIILSVKKVPAVLSLIITVLASSILAMFTQRVGIKALIAASMHGCTYDTGVQLVNQLLKRGGIDMMTNTVVMVMAATAMGGILEQCRAPQVILQSLIQRLKTPCAIILATLGACYLILLFSGSMMLGIIIVGRLFKLAYDELGIDRCVLSRTLEDSSTIGSAIVPWGPPGVYIQRVLDVGTEYIPYTYLTFFVPIFSVICAITGIAVWKTEGARNRTS